MNGRVALPRIGVFLGYWPWFTTEEQVDLAVLADRLGLDSVWVAEAWGHDAVSMLGLLAGKTERIALGSAIMQIPARQPAATAMAAASLDVISGGRFRLGLGLSGPQVSEGWYGVPFTSPLGRTREYVEIVRRALDGAHLEYDGEHFALPTPDGTGLGKPLKLLARPVQDRIPIYLAALGPKSLRQVGSIADGWIPIMFDPELEEPLDRIRLGAEENGRSLSDIDIAPSVIVAVDEDVERARDACRPWLAFYLGMMGADSKNFYVEHLERLGHGPAARAVQDAGRRGDRAAAAAAVTDEIVDTAALACQPRDLTGRLAQFAAGGADTVLCIPAGRDRAAVVSALAEERSRAQPVTR